MIKEISKEFALEEIKVLANNTEKFLSFQIGSLRVLDSLQFLNASLDTLVQNLNRDGAHLFKHTAAHFPNNLNLVTRKGVYPYEYMDSPSKFTETSLPPLEKFYSKLRDESVSDEDYEHARHVWNTLQLKNMRQYHDLYLTTDVLLLADVFETFRGVAMDMYILDPPHFYTAPGLSFNACLKYTDVKLELFTARDPNMLPFVEKGVRGGISTIVIRYAKANNS